MKLTIRLADKIVGVLIILALGLLVFVVFMLGSQQRWFSRDYYFTSYFPSATGLSQNMAVQYKGFTIGHVKSIRLANDDQVEVRFTIFDTYIDRVRYGSLVEVLVSPIGGLGGNQFMFYPGNGTDILNEGEIVPSVTSNEGRRLLSMGLAVLPERDDGINNIMNRVGTLLDTVNTLVADVQEAFAGSDRTSLGRTMGEVEMTLSSLQLMAGKLPGDLEDSIDRIMAQLEPILVNLRAISDMAADPDETVMSILASDGDVYTDLVNSLNAISGILHNLERTSDFIPAQLPALAVVLNDLSVVLKTAEDVLIALTNNPLLRRGIPERRETSSGATHMRDIEF